MRKLGQLVLAVLLQAARDKKALATTLVMPLMLIGILGLALQRVLQNRIEPVSTLLVVEDRGAQVGGQPLNFGRILAEKVLPRPNVPRLLQVERLEAEGNARDRVKADELVALIRVPANFTADTLAGKGAQVELLVA